MAQHVCPERRLEIIFWYQDSGATLPVFAKGVYTSVVTLRKWVHDFKEHGFQGLCTEQEWTERQIIMAQNNGYLPVPLPCCQDHKFSKQTLQYFQSLGEHFRLSVSQNLSKIA